MNRIRGWFCVVFLLIVSCDVFAQKDLKQEIDSIIDIRFEEIVAHPKESVQIYEKYIAIAEQEGNKEAIARLYTKLTLAHYYLGNYEKSTEYSITATKLFGELQMWDQMGNQQCETGYMMKRRDLDRAFDYMRQGLVLVKEYGDDGLLARNYNNFGVLHEMKEDIDSALYYYKSGLKLVEKLGDTLAIPYSLNNIFEALLMADQPDSALSYLERTAEIRHRNKDEMGITENYVLYGDYYVKKGDYNRAIESYQEALRRAKTHQYLYLMQYAAQKISESYEVMGDQGSALEYYKLATHYNDSLVNTETNKSIAELEIRYETEKKEKELAQQEVILAENAIKLKRRNEWIMGLVVVLLFILLAAWFIYQQQRLKQAKLIEENRLKDEIAKIQLVSELQEERLRISRDLHDNIGSQLTFIISSLDNLNFLLKKGERNVGERIEKINSFTRDTIAQFRDTIWAMNKEGITIEDIQSRTLNAITKARETGTIPDVRFEVNVDKDYAFNGTQGINLFRIIQEALNNAIKYARAAEIVVQFDDDNELITSIMDNGIGFDASNKGLGNGLSNMRRRAQELNGSVEIESVLGEGTKVIARVPKK